MTRVLVLALLAACTDNGPDLDNTTPFVGPCGFTAPDREATFEYDAAGRVARIVMDSGDSRVETVRAYDDTWGLTSSVTRTKSPDWSSTLTWTLGGGRATETLEGCSSTCTSTHRVYDLAVFQFFYPTWSAMVEPYGLLGMIEDDGTPVMVKDAPRRHTQRSIHGLLTFDFDDARRVVAMSLDAPSFDGIIDGRLDYSEHRFYEGDRLVSMATRGYFGDERPWQGLYDRGGNLAAEEWTVGYDTIQIVYDYSCW